MKKITTVLAIAFAMTLGVAGATETSEFEAIIAHYEGIRQALLFDTTEGVRDRANQIISIVESAPAESLADESTVCSENSEICRGIMEQVKAEALRLRSAKSIKESREAFGDLSTVLVKFRQGSGASGSVVAFCSMAQKVWLQPKGEIGNPYYGQSMAECGDIVSE